MPNARTYIAMEKDPSLHPEAPVSPEPHTQPGTPTPAPVQHWEHVHSALHAYNAVIAQSNAEEESYSLLLLRRAKAANGLAAQLRCIPPHISEAAAISAPDPTRLARAALKDAEAAIAELSATKDCCPASMAQAHLEKGWALYHLEKYKDAISAGQAVVSMHGLSPILLACANALLEECQNVSGKSKCPVRFFCPLRKICSKPTMAVPLPPQLALDDAECVLCFKLLWEPVTTPCGHSFCKPCLARAGDHAARCPVCRSVLHVGEDLPVTLALKNLLMKAFPEEYQLRASEEAHFICENGNISLLPLFVMAPLLPGERMALNIFEPRYRLMIRRCLAGGRKFGMATVDSMHVLQKAACEAEITEVETQPDGRYYIEIRGGRRFVPEQNSELDGYRTTLPLYFHDELTPEGSKVELQGLMQKISNDADALAGRLRALATSRRQAAELLRLAGERPSSGDAEALGFWVGNLVSPFLTNNAGFKMKLLECRDSLERLQIVDGVLSQLQRENSGCCIM